MKKVNSLFKTILCIAGLFMAVSCGSPANSANGSGEKIDDTLSVSKEKNDIPVGIYQYTYTGAERIGGLNTARTYPIEKLVYKVTITETDGVKKAVTETDSRTFDFVGTVGEDVSEAIFENETNSMSYRKKYYLNAEGGTYDYDKTTLTIHGKISNWNDPSDSGCTKTYSDYVKFFDGTNSNSSRQVKKNSSNTHFVENDERWMRELIKIEE